MQIKKRKVKSDIPSAKTGQIGPSIPTAKKAEVGSLVGANTMKYSGPGITANTAGSDMSVVARLRSAKKVKEEAMAPREKVNAVDEDGEFEVKSDEKGIWEDPNSAKARYMNRIKKKAK